MRIDYPTRQPAGTQPNGKPWPVFRFDQLEAIYKIVNEITLPHRSHSALVGAGMGSGKTVVSCEVILKTNLKRVLVVGVRDAYDQWADTYREQGGSQPFLRIINDEQGNKNLTKLLNGDDGLYYVGLEMLRAKDWEKVSETIELSKEVRDMLGLKPGEEYTEQKQKQKHVYSDMPKVDLLISDEAHKHSNQKSASVDTVRTIKADRKIALSGTFFGNKIENAWTIATWLWGKERIGSKTAFERNYCIKVPLMSKDGKKRITTPGGFKLSKIIGEQYPGEYVETLPCYVFIATPIGRVPKPEVVKVDLGAEQERQYREMETKSLTWIPSAVKASGRAPLVADLPIVQQGRLRTAALGGMTLVPGLTEDDSDSIRFDPGCDSSTLTEAYNVLHRPSWVGKKALILTHSKQFAIETARRIGQKYTVALKTGDVSGNQWKEAKARFMLPVGHPDSIQYLVAVISAVGTATDGLQANCAKVLWLSLDQNNVNNIQGSNRVWRDGVDLDEYEGVLIVQRHTIAEGVLATTNKHKQGVLDSVQGNN